MLRTRTTMLDRGQRARNIGWNHADQRIQHKSMQYVGPRLITSWAIYAWGRLVHCWWVLLNCLGAVVCERRFRTRHLQERTPRAGRNVIHERNKRLGINMFAAVVYSFPCSTHPPSTSPKTPFANFCFDAGLHAMWTFQIQSLTLCAI